MQHPILVMYPGSKSVYAAPCTCDVHGSKSVYAAPYTCVKSFTQPFDVTAITLLRKGLNLQARGIMDDTQLGLGPVLIADMT
jgi:hypothetical protein